MKRSGVTEGRLPILCYHKVGPAAEVGRRLNIEPSRLESHVRFFSRRGYRSVLARDLGASWPAHGVCFSFDDGFSSTMAHAPEILERHGMRGCFYVVSSLVGASSDWDGGESLPLADWDVLRGCFSAGHEIGNHTSTHPQLGLLGEAEAVAEISGAQERLLAEGIESRSFCYPYGSLPRAGEALIWRVGIPVGLSLQKGVARPSSSLLSLPRVTVAYSHSLPMLLYRLFVRFR